MAAHSAGLSGGGGTASLRSGETVPPADGWNGAAGAAQERAAGISHHIAAMRRAVAEAVPLKPALPERLSARKKLLEGKLGGTAKATRKPVGKAGDV